MKHPAKNMVSKINNFTCPSSPKGARNMQGRINQRRTQMVNDNL